MSWWLPSEDDDWAPLLWLAVLGLLGIAGLTRVPGVTSGVVSIALVLSLPAVLLGFPLLTLLLWACVVGSALCHGVPHDRVTGYPRLPAGPSCTSLSPRCAA